MESRKLEFSNKVTHMVRDICKVVFNVDPDADLEHVFGMPAVEMERVIKKISHALPDRLFNQPPHQLAEMENIFAKEFVFFQVQEREEDPHYQADLTRFVKVFTRDIEKRLKRGADVKAIK